MDTTKPFIQSISVPFNETMQTVQMEEKTSSKPKQREKRGLFTEIHSNKPDNVDVIYELEVQCDSDYDNEDQKCHKNERVGIDVDKESDDNAVKKDYTSEYSVIGLDNETNKNEVQEYHKSAGMGLDSENGCLATNKVPILSENPHSINDDEDENEAMGEHIPSAELHLLADETKGNLQTSTDDGTNGRSVSFIGSHAPSDEDSCHPSDSWSTNRPKKMSCYQVFTLLVGFVLRGYRSSLDTAFGVYYVQFLLYFNVNRAEASWGRAVEQVVSLISAFILGSQLDLLQPRYILVGSLLACAMGLISSSFAPGITTLNWLYGILIGVGITGLEMATTIITQRVIPGRSAFVSNFEMIGSSIGAIITPLVAQALVDAYSWRWAMRYHGIIGVNLAVVSWILRTPSTQKSETTITTSETFAPQSETALTKSETFTPQSETHITKSETFAPQSETPITPSGTFASQSETPITTSETFAITQHGTLLTKSETLATQSGTPITKSETFGTQPGTLTIQSGTPKTQSGSSSSVWQKFILNMKGLLALFTNVPFLLATVSNCFFITAPIMLIVHTPSRMISIGHTAKSGSTMIAIMAGAMCASRVVMLTFVSRVNPFILSAVTRIICSLPVILCLYNDTIRYQIVMFIIMGIGAGMANPLITPVSVELMGLDMLGRTSIVTNVALAISIFMGASVSASLYEATGSYSLPYHLGGGLGILSALLMLVIYGIRKFNSRPHHVI